MTRVPPPSQIFPVIVGVLMLFGGLHALSSPASGDDQADSQRPPQTEAEIVETVARLVDQLSHADKQQRANAIAQLGEMAEKAESAAGALVSLLAENKESIGVGRIASAISGHAERALCRIGKPAVPALVNGLKHDDIVVRRRAAQILGQIQDPRAIEPLIAVLDDMDRELTGAATTALGHLAPAAVEPLLRTLAEGSAQQRQYAAGALGATKDMRAVEPLLIALQAQDPLLQKWAAHALSNNLTDESKATLSRPENTRRLLDALKTDAKEFQSTMANLLYRLAPGIPELLIAALDDPDVRVRQGASIAIGGASDSRVIKPLLRIASVPSNPSKPDEIERRINAFQSLWQSTSKLERPDPILDVALPALQDLSPRIRAAAAAALRSIASKWATERRAVPDLIAALAVEMEGNTLLQIVQTLAETPDLRAVDPLLAVLTRPTMFSTVDDAPREKLNRQLVLDREAAIRDEVVKALAQIGDARAIPAIRTLLPMQRRSVLEALGQFHDQESVPEFIAAISPRALQTSEQINLATGGAKALTSTPDPRAVPALLQAMSQTGRVFEWNRDPYLELRQQLGQALAVVGDERAADALLLMARSVPAFPWTRATVAIDHDDGGISHHPAAWPLFKIGIPAVPRLIEELQTAPPNNRNDGEGAFDGTRQGREVAAWVLHNLFSQGGLQPGDGVVAIPTLIHALNDRSPLVRQHSVEALGSLKASQAIPALIQLVDHPRHALDGLPAQDDGPFAVEVATACENWQRRTNHILKAVARALSLIGDEKSVGAVEKLLKHESPDVRKSAVYAMLSTRHPQRIEWLLKLLSDPAEQVHETAVRQLGFASDRRIVQPLILELQASQPLSIRAMAAQSLGLLGDHAAADALAEAMQDPDHKLQLNSAVALLELNDDRGYETFRRMLTEEPASRREESFQHLTMIAMHSDYLNRARLIHFGARQLLLQVATTDMNVRVRAYGASALRGVSDEATINGLLTLIRDPEEWVRCDALSVFADTADSRAVDVLLKALKDDQPLVRRMAAHKLGRFKSLQVQSSLVETLRDADPDTREAALNALVQQKAVKVRESILELSRSDPNPKVRARAKRVASVLAGD